MPGSRLKRHAGSPAPKCRGRSSPGGHSISSAAGRPVTTRTSRSAFPSKGSMRFATRSRGWRRSSTDAVFRSAKRLSQRATRPGFGTLTPARGGWTPFASRGTATRGSVAAIRDSVARIEGHRAHHRRHSLPAARDRPPVQGEAHPREGSDGLRRRPPAARARWAAVAEALELVHPAHPWIEAARGAASRSIAIRLDGQRLSITQASHSGRRASHTRRPCQITRWGKRAQSARGTTLCRSRSILTGVLLASEPQPLREAAERAGRPRCPACPELSGDHIGGLAGDALKPHQLVEPRRTFPSYSSSRTCMVPRIDFAFAGKPVA